MTTDIRKAFEAAIQQVQNAPKDGKFKPGVDYQLKMYSLYRQAKDGDVQGKRPGLLDMVGRAKYDAWAKLKGMAAEEAMRQYVAEVEAVAKKYG